MKINIEETVEELLKKTPYLRVMKNDTLFITEKEIDEINNSEDIIVDNIVLKKDILLKILNEKNYQEYVENLINNKTKLFRLSAIKNNGLYKQTTIESKLTLVKGLNKLKEIQELTEKEESILKQYNKDVSINKLLNQTKIYSNSIDNEKYEIKTTELYEFITLPESKYKEIINDDKITHINNIAKSHFIYAVKDFFETNKVIKNYLLPKIIKNRINDLIEHNSYDTEAINTFLETKDSLYKDVEVNEELHYETTKYLPDKIKQLTKSQYLYIKLCKLLTYDEEYYATDQNGKSVIKHQTPNYINNISPIKNEAVCYEFNLIYSKLLNELGINFESLYKNTNKEEYGSTHVELRFRIDKFIIMADSVTSIINGDIYNAKVGNELKGLKCLNKNEQTRKEFDDILKKAYQIVSSQDENQQTNSLLRNLAKYQETTTSIKCVSIKEKFEVLKKASSLKKFKPIDSYSYILNLRKILFTIEEQENNFGMTIIRNNQPHDSTKIAETLGIIYLNEKSLTEQENKTIFYEYNPKYGLKKITIDKLQEKFNNSNYEYLFNSEKVIPGIKEKRSNHGK